MSQEFLAETKRINMRIQTIVLAVLLASGTFAVAQDANTPPPRRQGPPVVQCEEMKKLMKAVQDHRTTCEVCKTNLPPRGQAGGPRMGKGPRGQGQGQGGQRPPPPPPQE